MKLSNPVTVIDQQTPMGAGGLRQGTGPSGGGGAAPFSPEQVAGLTLWLDAASVTGSDGDVIGTWADLSGVANHATQATAGRRPLLKVVSGKKYLRFDGSDDSLVTAGLPWTSGAFTVIALVKQSVTTGAGYYFSADASASRGFSPGYNARYFDCPLWGVNSCYSTSSTVNDTTYGIRVVRRSSAPLVTFRLNDTAVTPLSGAPASALLSPTNTGAMIGAAAQGSSHFNGDIGALLVYTGELTYSQVQNVEAYLNTRYALSLTFKKMLVCDGDSWMAGYSTYTPCPTQLATLLGSGWELYNGGAGGETLANMESNAATTVDRYWASQNTSVLLTIGGINDIANGDSLATVQSRWITYMTNRRAAGHTHIVAQTLLTVNNVIVNAAEEIVRAAFNTWLKGAAAAAYYDHLFDAEAVTELADPNNATYRDGDHVHPTTAGNAAWAAALQTFLSGLGIN